MSFVKFATLTIASIDATRATFMSTSGLLSEPIVDESAVLASLDPVTRDLFANQVVKDMSNDHLSYSLEEGVWPSHVPTPEGPVALDMTTQTATGAGSVVFSTISSPHRLVKFIHDCVLIDTESAIKAIPHPALTEYWFGTAAETVGPHYFYVSPPMPFPSHPLFPDIFSAEAIHGCQAAGAAVRFILVEKPQGTNLHTHLSQQTGERYTPSTAFHFGARLVDILSTLHSRRIAHGNLRLEDVFVNFDSTGNLVGMVLGGFDSPRVSWIHGHSGESLSRSLPKPAAEDVHLSSPWELADGHTYSIRDDMYRLMQLISTTLNGIFYTEGLTALGASLADYKLSTPVLQASPSIDPLRCLGPRSGSKSELMTLMNQLSEKISTITLGDYKQIKETLFMMSLMAHARVVAPSAATRLGFLRAGTHTSATRGAHVPQGEVDIGSPPKASAHISSKRAQVIKRIAELSEKLLRDKSIDPTDKIAKIRVLAKLADTKITAVTRVDGGLVSARALRDRSLHDAQTPAMISARGALPDSVPGGTMLSQETVREIDVGRTVRASSRAPRTLLKRDMTVAEPEHDQTRETKRIRA